MNIIKHSTFQECRVQSNKLLECQHFSRQLFYGYFLPNIHLVSCNLMMNAFGVCWTNSHNLIIHILAVLMIQMYVYVQILSATAKNLLDGLNQIGLIYWTSFRFIIVRTSWDFEDCTHCWYRVFVTIILNDNCHGWLLNNNLS